MTYTVTLVNCAEAPANVRCDAEASFRAALDGALGDRVAPCLCAFVMAQEEGVGRLTREELIDAAGWIDAFESATIAGCLALGEIGNAYFEVRLP